MILKAQDGSLLNFDTVISLNIQKREEAYLLQAFTISSKEITLGTYESKESANKALDSIFEALRIRSSCFELEKSKDVWSEAQCQAEDTYSVEDLMFVGFSEEEAEKAIQKRKNKAKVRKM